MEVFLTQLLIATVFCTGAMLIVRKLTPKLEYYCKSKVFVWIAIAIYLRSLFVLPLPAFPGKGGRIIQGIVLILQSQRQEAVSATTQSPIHIISFGLIDFLFFAWLAVFLLLVFYRLKSMFTYYLELRAPRHIIAVPEILDALSQAKDDMGVTDRVSLFSSAMTLTPLISGMWSANYVTIYIPEFFYKRYKKGRVTAHDFYLLFRHELAHYVAHDDLLALLISLAWYVHWFNPVFYKFTEQIRDKIECARDDMAMKGLSSEDADQMVRLLRIMMRKSINENGEQKDSWLSAILSTGHSFSAVKDFKFRENNMYDTRSPNSNFRFFVISAILVAFTIVMNCSGLLDQMLNPASWNFSWKTAEASATVPGGEISFAYPIQNPTKILTPSTYGRNDYSNINRLIFEANLGTNVYAPISGEIIDVGYTGDIHLGNNITIKNSSLIVTISHLTTSDLSVGDTVIQNQLIGVVDDSGRSIIDGSEILLTDLQGNPVDVVSYLEGVIPISI